MRKSLDTKTVMLVVLTAFAVVLTLFRERSVAPAPTASQVATEEGPPLAQIAPIIDSTLKQMGVNTEKIRRLKISVGELKGRTRRIAGSCAPCL